MFILVVSILVISIGILLGKYQEHRDKQVRIAHLESRRRYKKPKR